MVYKQNKPINIDISANSLRTKVAEISGSQLKGTAKLPLNDSAAKKIHTEKDTINKMVKKYSEELTLEDTGARGITSSIKGLTFESSAIISILAAAKLKFGKSASNRQNLSFTNTIKFDEFIFSQLSKPGFGLPRLRASYAYAQSATLYQIQDVTGDTLKDLLAVFSSPKSELSLTQGRTHLLTTYALNDSIITLAKQLLHRDNLDVNDRLKALLQLLKYPARTQDLLLSEPLGLYEAAQRQAMMDSIFHPFTPSGYPTYLRALIEQLSPGNSHELIEKWFGLGTGLKKPQSENIDSLRLLQSGKAAAHNKQSLQVKATDKQIATDFITHIIDGVEKDFKKTELNLDFDSKTHFLASDFSAEHSFANFIDYRDTKDKFDAWADNLESPDKLRDIYIALDEYLSTFFNSSSQKHIGLYDMTMADLNSALANMPLRHRIADGHIKYSELSDEELKKLANNEILLEIKQTKFEITDLTSRENEKQNRLNYLTELLDKNNDDEKVAFLRENHSDNIGIVDLLS